MRSRIRPAEVGDPRRALLPFGVGGWDGAELGHAFEEKRLLPVELEVERTWRDLWVHGKALGLEAPASLEDLAMPAGSTKSGQQRGPGDRPAARARQRRELFEEEARPEGRLHDAAAEWSQRARQRFDLAELGGAARRLPSLGRRASAPSGREADGAASIACATSAATRSISRPWPPFGCSLAHHIEADRRVPDHRGGVDRRASPLDRAEKLGKVSDPQSSPSPASSASRLMPSTFRASAR
jgi:hypothetical protein